MACIQGSDGVLKIGADGSETTVAGVRAYSVTHSVEVVDNTTIADGASNGYRSVCAGLKSWEGSMDLMWDEQDTGVVVGSTYNMVLYPKGATDGFNYEGQILVTTLDISASADGQVEATISFTGTGSLTTTA